LTWPPPPPEEPDVPHRPWNPRHRRAPGLVKEYERLVYIVIDEIVEDWVGLSVSLWPHADDNGRLRFADPRGSVEVGTSRTALRRFLETGEHHDPKAPEPRIGDTFTARVQKRSAEELLELLRRRAGHGEARVKNLGTFLERPVELNDEGRLLAKLASFGAVLSTIPQKFATEMKPLKRDKK
jgi:hypothetical protein